MASSFFALLDDIATVMDDVMLMTKLAAKKTAGVLGDDLALNAEQASGVTANRELPVVWAISKGSVKNKAILVPLALLISALLPILVTPLLMLGGLYLCFEGVEKLFHKFLHPKIVDDVHHVELITAIADPKVDMVAFEKEKIKMAVRTDFILSAEIVTITLGEIAAEPLLMRVAVLIAISFIMTIGVYGSVAAIVKLDDLGLKLLQKTGAAAWKKCQRLVGRSILATAPYLMKALSVAGTAAMFLVGGGILVHGLTALRNFEHIFSHSLADITGLGAVWLVVAPLLFTATVGLLAGALALGITKAGVRFLKTLRR